MNRIWNWYGAVGRLGALGLALSAACLLLGCASGGGSSLVQYYGHYHPAGWISAHGGQAVPGLVGCTRCHELSLLKVGSGVPSCLTTGCHHQATPGYADPALHGVRAKMLADPTTGGSLVSCQLCHGRDFSGGPSANACVTCHGVQAPHPPKTWRSSAGTPYTHTTTDPSNAAVCAQCHYSGSPSNPAGHPVTPAPAGTQPDCYNATLCHGASTAPHPVPFLRGQTDTRLNGHLTVTAAAFAADCATCHAYSGTAPVAAAPLCKVCHLLADPTAAGTQAGTCLSCHAGTAGLPQGPGGSAFPSLAGAHAKHLALATQLTCDTCHAGAGTGTTTHYLNADLRLPNPPTGPATVALDPVFAALTGGSPSFTASSLTCASVSCHGGQTTPGWQNGTLATSSQCTACHGVAATAGTITQYNDAVGRHSLGTHNAANGANGITCTTCHDMTNGSPGALAHFKYLRTQAVDGTANGTPADQLPSGTIAFDPVVVTAGTYAVTSATQGNGSCALTCHTHLHTGAPLDTWTSTGASHPVPFLSGQTDTQGHGHLTATQATFTADCSACHAYAGTPPSPGAPLCSVCHAVADPTLAATGTGTCLSCHPGTPGMPAGPTDATYPSVAGAHAKHMALPTPLTCDTCHAGSGAGSTPHYTHANARLAPPTGPASVSLAATYNAQSGGSAAFNPSSLTCAATSCHGGKTTPNWRTGTIASTSQCSLCHAINGGTTTSQYNDAVGRHSYGTHYAASSLDCTLCHDMSSTNANLGAANHFAELNSPAVSSTNKLPSGTIKFTLTNPTYPITGTATYDVTTAPFTEGDGGCSLTCHNQIHVPSANHWGAPQGSGVAHPVPFYNTGRSTAGYSHQTTTLAQFNLECTTCHDLGGSTAKAGPVCAVCHTLADPTATATGVGTCLSCHVGSGFQTQGPKGTAWPNLQGAHPKHLALLTFTRSAPALPTALTASAFPACEACHVGSVPYDTAQTHYSDANKRVVAPIASGPGSVSIAPTFNAQAGTAGITASASAFTCSNVSCHGGQVTPGWQTGTIPVNATTYCVACHKVASPATQYNDAVGRHANPSEHRQTCDYCHSMTQAKPGAQNHFKYLDTSSVSGVSGTPFDQYPSDTILFGTSVTANRTTGAGPTYSVTSSTQGRGGCTLYCHGENHTTSGNLWN